MRDDLDTALLERFVRGDGDAFETLFRHFQVDVYRWAMRIVRNTAIAEEVTVEAFWRAYRGRAGFDSTRSFGAWMRRIATNASIDHLRKMRPGVRWDTLAETTPAPLGTNPEVKEALMLAFRTLSPKLRAIATLALVEDQPYADIADALDIPIGTVKSRVFRAVRMLRQELQRLGVGPDA